MDNMDALRCVVINAFAVQLPVGLPESGLASEQVLVAYDGMRLPLKLLTAAPKVMGPLVLAFTKEDEQ